MTDRYIDNKVAVMDDESEFSIVSKTLGFIDKTHFIRPIIGAGGRRILFTAPSRFGKSTNIDMLKQFLSDRSERGTYTSFKAFNVRRNVEFYRNNCCRHPVIHLNFSSGAVNSYSDALMSYRWAIHNAFVEHYYLLKRDESTFHPYDYTQLQRWCNVRSGYRAMQYSEIVDDLGILINLVKRDRKPNVVVLIDDYDGVVNKAMFDTQSDQEFSRIAELTGSILDTVLNNPNVNIVVMTGTHDWLNITNLLKDIGTLEVFPFLESPEFRKFHGFSVNDVMMLLNKMNIEEEQAMPILTNSCKYKTSSNKSIFHPFIVLKYLETKRTKGHWHIGEFVARIMEGLTYEHIAQGFELLLRGYTVLRQTRQIMVEDMISIRNTFLPDSPVRNKPKHVDMNKILPYIIDLGLLTYTKFIGKTTNCMCIANDTTKQVVMERFQLKTIQICNVTKAVQSPDQIEFYNAMQSLYNPTWNKIFKIDNLPSSSGQQR